MSCGGSADPVAAFWGSDKGEKGYPGRTPEAPTGGDIWIITAAGDMAPLTDDAISIDPWLSDDARRVYFGRSPEGGTANITDLWVHDLGSGVETRLVALDPAIGSGVLRPGELRSPEESPDRTRVAYAAATGGNLQLHLWVLDLDSLEPPTRLPPPPEASGFPAQYEPTWSPDGSSLAYLYDERDADGWSIRLFEIESGTDSVVYDPAGNRTHLRGLEWSPDGKSLLVSETGSEPEIADVEVVTVDRVAVTIDLATGGRQVLAEDVASAATYTSADGSTLSAIDYTIEQYRSPDEEDAPMLIGWNGHDGPVVSPAPIRLSFARGLTVANCAFGDTKG